MSYIKEIRLTDEQRREDLYWGPKKVTIEASEYDALVEDSHALATMEDALIDFLTELRKARKQRNMTGWLADSVATYDLMIFTEEGIDKMVGRIKDLTEGLKKATSR